MSKFWENRNVLVTGGSGFVGGHLIKRLQKLGANVTSFSYDDGTGDVTDIKSIRRLIKRKKIDTIYHLAAQSTVEEGQKSPYSAFNINVMGTTNILESALELGVRRVVIASTSHVYGDNPNLPYKESYYPRPSRPYETSKSCADLIAQSYANSYGLSVYIARFVNTYGPGDPNFNRVIPHFIKNLLTSGNIEVYGGKSVRDYIYIDDAIDAYILLGKAKNNSSQNHIFNFGSGHPINVIDLAKTIIKLTNVDGAKVIVTPDKRENEVVKQYVSSAKAKRILKWEPKYTLQNGLKKTISEYKKQFSIDEDEKAKK